MTSLAGLTAVAMTFNVEPEDAMVMAAEAIEATETEHDAILDVVRRARISTASHFGGFV
jgi:hypothetical protein